MAAYDNQKAREMEEEMSRFEQEILSNQTSIGQVPLQYDQHHDAKFILGARTFTQVQAQIHGDPPGPYPSNPQQVFGVGFGLPRPQTAPQMQHPPAFIPHQLKPRSDGPRMAYPPPPPMPAHMRPPVGSVRPPMMRPMPPMGEPPMGRIPVRPLMGAAPLGPGMVGPTIPTKPTYQPPIETSTNTSNVERPRVVYASAPVLNIPGKSNGQKDGEPPNKISRQETEQIEVTIPESAMLKQPPPILEMLAHKDKHVQQEHALEQAKLLAKKDKKKKEKKMMRMAAGTVWEDNSLAEWDPDDFRIFCGDLGNEVTDEALVRIFSRYPSFTKAKVVRDKRTQKSRGYGFVSFKDPVDFTKAIREVNGKYVGNRPIKLRKSAWKDRNVEVVKKKEREKKRLGLK